MHISHAAASSTRTQVRLNFLVVVVAAALKCLIGELLCAEAGGAARFLQKRAYCLWHFLQ